VATVTLAAYANPNRPARFLGPQEFISNGISISLAIFVTARRYASAVLAVVVCLSVCLSVTSRYCIKMTTADRITQITPHDSPGTLVFGRQNVFKIRTGSPPTGAPNGGGVG